MLRIKEMLNPGYAKPTASEKKAKSEEKEVAVKKEEPAKKQEAKDSSTLAPAKKAGKGLAGKLALLGSRELTDFQNDVVDAFNAVRDDKNATDKDKARAAIYIQNIKMCQNTDADVVTKLNNLMNHLKTKKKNIFWEDLSHYNLFTKHINPVLEKHKSSLDSSAAPVKKKA